MENQELTMHKLLDIMREGEDIKLSELGKREVDKNSDHLEEPRSSHTWTILAINADDTINICNSVHYEVGGVSLDWIERG